MVELLFSMVEYFILAWLFFLYAAMLLWLCPVEYYLFVLLFFYYAAMLCPIVLSGLVGIWICRSGRNKYEKIAQIVSEKPILCKMVAFSDSQLRFYKKLMISSSGSRDPDPDELERRTINKHV